MVFKKQSASKKTSSKKTTAKAPAAKKTASKKTTSKATAKKAASKKAPATKRAESKGTDEHGRIGTVSHTFRKLIAKGGKKDKTLAAVRKAHSDREIPDNYFAWYTADCKKKGLI